MNNSAFRDLISSKDSVQQGTGNAQDGGFKKPNMSLGSRMRSSIPMTPRSLPGQRQNAHASFARQVAEATSSGDNEGRPAKRFRGSAAPKGSRLASGYTDRASLLRNGADAEDTDDKEKRVRALEEMYKLQQIDLETFERLRDEIGVGGDVSSTHLVRGLDWKLLERVRRGEDITNKTPEESEDKTDMPDVDAEFDKALESNSTEAQRKEPAVDKENGDDNLSQSHSQSSRTMSRDEILQRLKQSRQNPQKTFPTTIDAPVLNDKFKKIPSKTGPKKEKFIEDVNGRRREVLLITNPDGTSKRKSRWLDPETVQDTTHASPQNGAQPKQSEKKVRKKADDPEVLGMEVPAEIAAREAARQAAEEAAAEEDDDIFQGVGDDYDPLGDIQNSDDDDENNKTQDADTKRKASPKHEQESNKSQPPTTSTNTNTTKRNYFSATTDTTESEDRNPKPNKDPTILAALKRAAELRKREEENGSENNSGQDPNSNSTDKSKAFLAKLRENERQDAADLDMGFGGSRFDDEDDAEGGDLHDFNDGAEDDNDDGKGNKVKARKKGKKRKGDKNNFADVMSVLQRQKQ